MSFFRLARIVVCSALAMVALWVPQEARAQRGPVVSEYLEELGVGPQVTNVVTALAQMPKASKGGAGADALATYLMNFDELACQTLVVQFSLVRRNLIINDAPPETIREAYDLFNKLYKACQPILEPDVDFTAGGGEDATEPEPPEDIKLVDGVLIDSVPDKICWQRCQDEWSAWKTAEAQLRRTQRQLVQAERRAWALSSNVIPSYHDQIRNAQSELEELRNLRQSTNSISEKERLRQRISQTELHESFLRQELAKAEQDLTRLEQQIPELRQEYAEAQKQVEETLQAYLDCLRRCQEQANAVDEHSRFVERTIERLTPRLELMRPKREETQDRGEADERFGLLPDRSPDRIGMAEGAYRVAENASMVPAHPTIATSLSVITQRDMQTFSDPFIQSLGPGEDVFVDLYGDKQIKLWSAEGSVRLPLFDEIELAGGLSYGSREAMFEVPSGPNGLGVPFPDSAGFFFPNAPGFVPDVTADASMRMRAGHLCGRYIASGSLPMHVAGMSVAPYVGLCGAWTGIDRDTMFEIPSYGFAGHYMEDFDTLELSPRIGFEASRNAELFGTPVSFGLKAEIGVNFVSTDASSSAWLGGAGVDESGSRDMSGSETLFHGAIKAKLGIAVPNQFGPPGELALTAGIETGRAVPRLMYEPPDGASLHHDNSFSYTIGARLTLPIGGK